MGITTYFFDTYAFYELINGNPNYLKYSKNVGVITTKFNLMELHYGLILLHGKEKADNYYNQFAKFCIEFDDNVIKSSNSFRYMHKSKKLSYVDCIGYTISKTMNIKFLTGDKAFENMENVEFVK